MTRELSREALAVHDSRTSDGEETIGLSRTSALNNRYFDDKSKSKSLDNLVDSSPKNIMASIYFYSQSARHSLEVFMCSCLHESYNQNIKYLYM